jgi:N-acylglucosamine 2-epimerase
MFFHVTRDGQPIRKRRYAYSEAFAAIAFAAHYGATGDRESYELANRLFRFFTHWNFTPGVMPPKTTDVRPMISICPRMIAIVTAQELRCHGVEVGSEPYPGDASSWPSEPVASRLSIEGWIDRCIDEMERYFVKADRRVVMESVSPTGEVIDHFDGRLLNPGHAIEGAWFILRQAAQRGDQRLVKLGSDMIDWMWQRGWDEQHGGLLYFRDLDDKPVQEYWADMKFWWPHNETIIATLIAYELTGQERFARMHQLVHDWSHRHFADREHGEWFGYLHRDGHVAMTTKGNLWKSFFHLPRMQWTCWQWLEQAGHRR